MARLPRLFIPGCPQHIMQRGHNGMAVFLDDQDRQHYLAWLVEAMRLQGVALHGYALVGNHAHLLASAPAAAASSAVMQSVGRRYAQYFNERYAHRGTIWEGRFRSTVVASEAYVVACYRYIDLNPVRAGLVEHPAQYPWSSYLHHVGRRIDAFVTDHPLYWALGNTPFERQAAYERLCATGADEKLAQLMTDTVLKGWALGEPPPEHDPPSRRAGRLRPGRPRKAGSGVREANSGNPGDEKPER